MNTRFLSVRLIVVAHLTLLASRVAATNIVVPGDPGDGIMDVNGEAQNFTNPTIRVGTGGDIVRGIDDIFFFRLPAVAAPSAITSANLRLAYLGVDGQTSPEFNIDLFGLGVRNSATMLSSDYYAGDSAGGSGTLIQANFLTPSTTAGTLNLMGLTQVGFTSYLQSLYQANGSPLDQFLVIRLNPDVPLPPFSNPIRGFLMASADNSDPSLVPELLVTATAVPEPSTALIASLGGLALLLLVVRRRK